MNAVKTDVIIPAYHPGEEFDKLLERLSTQKYPVNKIIVMNTEKKFWRENWEQKYPLVEVHHLTKQEFDHGATRRRGAELSDAEILIFMTQDALPADRNLVGNLVQAVAGNEKTGAAYARQLPKNDCGFLEKYTRSFNYPEQSCLKTEKDIETRGIKTYFCSNVCAAYDHRIYNEIGGFPEHAIFNEDMIYAGWMVKKGYAVAYAAEAKVYHSHNYSCSQQFHRNFDLGVSQQQLPLQYPDSLPHENIFLPDLFPYTSYPEDKYLHTLPAFSVFQSFRNRWNYIQPEDPFLPYGPDPAPEQSVEHNVLPSPD